MSVPPISQWYSPKTTPSLRDDEVHVWRTHLDLPLFHIQKLAVTLSEDERKRAARFFFPEDRNHFIAGRGVLRAILSSYLGISPTQLRFRYGLYGKPALLTASSSERLCFNLSHSQGLALYAVTRDREIGVDVEYIRPDFANEEVAKHFFSDRENAELSSLPQSKKVKGFFTCWTRKEAYIKARGQGLSILLDQFDVSVDPEESVSLLNVSVHPEEASRWSLQSLNVGSGYVAALAVEGHHWKLQFWQPNTSCSEIQIR